MNIEIINSFYEDIKNAKKNKKAFFYKNFIEFVPEWNSFMRCVFEEMSSENIRSYDFNLDAGEFSIGNVIVTEHQYFSPQTLDYKKYFPEIIEFLKLVENFNMQITFVGAKIAVGPRVVNAHQDSWDGVSMQCVGTAIWTIKCNETGYEEKFKMNPGDLLYFPQECTHEIISDTARANLIFNIPPEHLLL